jgi:hypothetical protein
MEISGQLHVPAAVPPLPIQQEAGWTPGPVWEVLEKRNSLLSLELETQTKRPHITKRRGIRRAVSGVPASYSMGPALNPRLKTAILREFNDFPQTRHTKPTTGSFHILSNSGTIRHYTICATQPSLHKQIR